ncbi:MAG TPA: hypothetical protein ENO14_00165, partial [Chromatiales bacterium]|nr:hypothetical protein [Chromatiales bacterium]
MPGRRLVRSRHARGGTVRANGYGVRISHDRRQGQYGSAARHADTGRRTGRLRAGAGSAHADAAHQPQRVDADARRHEAAARGDRAPARQGHSPGRSRRRMLFDRSLAAVPRLRRPIDLHHRPGRYQLLLPTRRLYRRAPDGRCRQPRPRVTARGGGPRSGHAPVGREGKIAPAGSRRAGLPGSSPLLVLPENIRQGRVDAVAAGQPLDEGPAHERHGLRPGRGRAVRQPERRFLLDCLAGRAPRPVAGMDWSSFLDCALENGVAALAYERLRDSGGLALLPSYAAEKLHKNYVSKGFRNIGCMEELGEILAALRAANIETIVLKGAAFAGSLWRNPAVRTMRDFDLMVRRSQLEAAGSVLRGMGFMPDERRASEDFYRLSHHHQAPMVHPGHNLIVEIHWNIVAPHDGLCLSPDRLWDRAVEARIAGRDALTLSMEDHILHLCLHAACDDPFHGKIVSVLDIAELLRASQHDWDWNLLLREAEAGGYSRFLYYPLYLAARLFRAPVPAGVLRSLRRASRMGAAEDRLVKA